MAVEEGFKRVRLLSRGALLLGGALLVLTIALHALLPVSLVSSVFVATGLLWVGGVYLMVLGGLGWAVGWVAEGFVSGREPAGELRREP